MERRLPNRSPAASTPTRWLIAAAVLVVVILVCAAVIVMAIGRDDGGTRVIDTSTSTTLSVGGGTSRSTVQAEPSGVDEQVVTLDVDGVQRSAMVVSPAEIGEGGQLPAVVALHGMGVTAKAMSNVADWRAAVARDRFVAVFPQGLDNSWNLGPCCPPSNLRGVDDEAFLDAVFAELRGRPLIDGERIYLTGFSNGALMAYVYACTRSDDVAALAVMAGSNVTNCAPTRPMSLMHQHGDVDLVVPFGGGIAIGSLVSSAPFPPVESSVAEWAAEDGCASEPVVVTETAVRRTTWTDCADGTEVQLIRVAGKGHDWLRSGSFDPLAEILAFFDLS